MNATMSAADYNPSPHAENIFNPGAITLRRDRLLAQNLIIGLVIGAANALVLTWFLVSYISISTGAFWMTALTVTMVIRTLIASNVWRSKRNFRAVEMWMVMALTVLSGAIWGMTPYLIEGSASHETELVAIFLCAGMTAAAGLTFATHMKVVIAFNVPALLIFMSAFVHPITVDGIAVAVVLAIYLVGTIVIASRIGSTTNDSIEKEIIAAHQNAEIVKNKDVLRKQLEALETSETKIQSTLAQTRRFNETLDALYQSYVVNSKPTIHLFKDVSECVSRALGCGRVSIWTFSDDGSAIICDDLYQADTNSHDAGQRLEEVAFPEYFEALRSCRCINAPDAESDSVTKSFLDVYLRPLNIKSMLDAPIRSSHGVRGVICCESVGDIRNWTIDEIAFVSSVAQFITMRLLTDSADKLAHDLNDALSAARSANDAKLMFLATMSHEIRTPMNGVLGAAAILKKQPLDDKANKFVSVIDQCGTNLLNILNDILDFSKIESDKIDLEEAPFSLRRLISSIESIYTLRADEKGLGFAVEIDDSLNDARLGDQHRVSQLLHNLLSNAFKFTEKGVVGLKVSVAADDGDDNAIIIDVTDSGVGISEDRILHIFDSFVQADSSTTRRYGGSGLGLSIVKGIVDAMGGNITVQSQMGVGTTFKAVLPLPLARDGVVQRHKKLEKIPADTKPISVLVAEDNQTNRLIVNAFLQKETSQLVFAENGKEAVEAFKNGAFDIVLMDIHMPEMDGVEALGAIRRYERENNLAATPIIAVTADAMQDQVQAYKKAGFNDHVAKPISESALLETIAQNIHAANVGPKAIVA